MSPGEIYLAEFPFGGIPGMKLRPILSLTAPIGSVPEVLVAYISSVLPQTPLPTDLILDPTQPEHTSPVRRGKVRAAPPILSGLHFLDRGSACALDSDR